MAKGHVSGSPPTPPSMGRGTGFLFAGWSRRTGPSRWTAPGQALRGLAFGERHRTTPADSPGGEPLGARFPASPDLPSGGQSPPREGAPRGQGAEDHVRWWPLLPCQADKRHGGG
eukprot:CAMPEP_0174915584 /NCGR_PEP_ID=MMETSP1355-20121228/1193_1 /TAXON_ID=464990 /ORGANISM="Hemiselmis tepida, Strain CCMP443" /LENGTH=114 /DNA_ID=CAMNT_0016160491 /DNA_START=1 /DNA_END=345 /DNA_ORIENTATION=+